MLQDQIKLLIFFAIKKAFQKEIDPEIVISKHEGQGDFASNICMILTKEFKKPPLQIAAEIVKNIPQNDLLQKVEIAPPGFLNFFLKNTLLEKELLHFDSEKNFDFLRDKKIVLDFSHPNIAKPLHFGHFRSTVIGESLVRILRYAGAFVLADNYLGDWGTQFGKLIVAIKKWGNEEQIKKNPIQELVALYRKIHEEIKNDPTLEDAGREECRKIEQDHDQENLKKWHWIVDVSYEQLEKFYQRLDIHFDSIRGESYWEKYIPEGIDLMMKQKILQENDGAMLVFFADETKLPPMIYKRRDGASLYQTRDIARIYFHEKENKWTDLVYVVDEGQSLHFRQLIATAKMLGFKIKITHANFGFILDENNKKLSTREGTSLGVDYVLDEAEEKVAKILREKKVQEKTGFSDQEIEELKKTIAIGAVKFNDLGQSRTRNITFNWEKILSFDGYSAPFLQYSYARGRSILRKVDFDFTQIKAIKLTQESELALTKKIINFGNIILDSANKLQPNVLAEYLFELASLFNKFYANAQVLTEEKEQRESRLFLVNKTCETLKKGLFLLGIKAPEKM